jgi:hypothetical protein
MILSTFLSDDGLCDVTSYAACVVSIPHRHLSRCFSHHLDHLRVIAPAVSFFPSSSARDLVLLKSSVAPVFLARPFLPLILPGFFEPPTHCGGIGSVHFGFLGQHHALCWDFATMGAVKYAPQGQIVGCVLELMLGPRGHEQEVA